MVNRRQKTSDRQWGFVVCCLSSVVCAFLLLAGCSQNSTWQRIESDGVLRVGVDPTYPPFENLEGDTLTGIDIELARAISAELNLTPQFDLIAFDGLYDALFTNRVDMLISALVLDDTRSNDFAFSDPYFNAGQVLITPTDSVIKELTDLTGKAVAVELGAAGHVEATQWQRRVADLEIVTLTEPQAVMDAVEMGSADAAIIDNITAQLNLPETLIIADPAVTVEPFAIVVRADDKQLLSRLNQSLNTLEKSGQLEQILDVGFGQSPTPPKKSAFICEIPEICVQTHQKSVIRVSHP